jgi:membrane fusion protein (multidrug efflux system)
MNEIADNNSLPPSKKRNQHILIYCGIVFVLLIAFLLYWLFVLQYYEYTDDAYVEGNMVYVTSLRPGFITQIHSDDTFLVRKGQLLIELDRTDAEIALNKAKEELANVVREVCRNFHQVFVYQADIEIVQAELIRAKQDYQHRQDVIAAGGVSTEDIEHAKAALDASTSSLQRAKTLHKQALSLVQGTTIKGHPQVLASANRVREMSVQLKRCKIHSPVEGLVAQRKAQVGMWIDPGMPLMSVIPLNQIWVNANFKETQMKAMRIGQKVSLTSDYYGGENVYHGVVVGLPGAAGDAFSILPPQNLSGNWIKIVQRVPVRIGLDPQQLHEHPLRIGLSMEATVDLSSEGNVMVPASTDGPLYATSIFDEELQGIEEIVQEIIRANMDPKLSEFANTPLVEQL